MLLKYGPKIQRIAILCSNNFTVKIPIKKAFEKILIWRTYYVKCRVMLRKIIDFKVD